MFNYEVQFTTSGLQLYKFSEVQREAYKFKEGNVHEMCMRCVMCKAMGLWTLDQFLTNV